MMPLVPVLGERYHIVGFDQRGTGGSGLLRCPELERDARLRSVAAGEACAREIGDARRFYTTPDSVEDLEAIRQQLGVERLTLFGVSYGTELGLAYARAHPDHVERLILDSVVDPDDRDPFGLAGFRAMGPSLAGLCPGRCRGISRDPLTDLTRLATRLRADRARGVAYDRRGRGHRRSVGQTALADLMYDSDYNPPLRAALPAAVHAALRGDDAPLVRLVAEGDKLSELPSPKSFSSARYATVCEETPLPWDASTPMDGRLAEARRRAAAVGAAAFRPFDLRTAAADEIGLCLHWPGVPSGRVAAPAAPYPAVPTLILQGGEDLRTPPEGSADVASAIPGAQRVVVPGVGHAVVGGDPSGCGLRALERFLDDRAGPRRLPARADRRAGGRGAAADAARGRSRPRPARPGGADGARGGRDDRRPGLRDLAGVPLLLGRRPARRLVQDPLEPPRGGAPLCRGAGDVDLRRRLERAHPAAGGRPRGGARCGDGRPGRPAERATRRAARARAAAGLRRRGDERLAGAAGRCPLARASAHFRAEVVTSRSGSVTRALTGSRSVRRRPHDGRQP